MLRVLVIPSFFCWGKNMQSWHDFHIVAHSVAGKDRLLTFDLEWPYPSAPITAPAKLEFAGVECYLLEHDLGSNIVYAFSETPIRSFLEQWQDRFESECRWGWPKFWRTTSHPPRPVAEVLEDAFQYLTSKNVKCIELSSSYGLSGWILASGVEERPLQTQP